MDGDQSLRVRVYVDPKLAVAWIYSPRGEDPANDHLIDVTLFSASSRLFMRIGHDGVSSRGNPYRWQSPAGLQ